MTEEEIKNYADRETKANYLYSFADWLIKSMKEEYRQAIRSGEGVSEILEKIAHFRDQTRHYYDELRLLLDGETIYPTIEDGIENQYNEEMRTSRVMEINTAAARALEEGMHALSCVAYFEKCRMRDGFAPLPSLAA